MRLKIVLAVMAAGMLFMLGGCGKPTYTGKADKTPYETRQCNRELAKGTEIDPNMIIDRLEAFKSKRMIYGYRHGKKVFESRMSIGKNGDKGTKMKAGDYRTPEGHYTIVRKKCDPRLYRSLMISYPNKATLRFMASQSGMQMAEVMLTRLHMTGRRDVWQCRTRRCCSFGKAYETVRQLQYIHNYYSNRINLAIFERNYIMILNNIGQTRRIL